MVTAAQSGKSSAILDIAGHRLSQSPVPILYVGPTKQFITEQFEPRVMWLLDNAPTLRTKVLRGKKMTKTKKVIAGVPWRLAHAGSTTPLKSDPAGLAFIDEIDDMVKNIRGKGGDPLGLVLARGDTYADFVAVITSTPTQGVADIERDAVSGLDFWKVGEAIDVSGSAIWNLWQSGTRHHWAWPCPLCERWFIPRFRNLKWPKDASPFEARRKAWLECPHCEQPINHDDKAKMNAAGVYVAPGQIIDRHGKVTGNSPDSDIASFWVSGLASPFQSWGERAELFITATRAGEGVQTAINQGFGELWAPSGGETPEWREVAACRHPYSLAIRPDGEIVEDGTMPSGIRILTAAVDVHRNRLTFAIRGWGTRATSWLVGHGELWGPTHEWEVWDALHDLIHTPICGMRIARVLIDSGFRPDKIDSGPENMVYEFCRRNQFLCRPCKGSSTSLGAPFLPSSIEVVNNKRNKYGLELYRIDTDQAKTWVHDHIRWPKDRYGAWFLADETSEDYCRQIVSEARLRKPSGRAIWVQRSRANHALDLEAMLFVTGYSLNVHRLAPPPKTDQPPEQQSPDSKIKESMMDPDVAKQLERIKSSPPSRVIRSPFEGGR